MRADGCSLRSCHFPKDKYGEVIPLSMVPLNAGQDEFTFYIEWDRHYRNAPATVRKRTVCIECSDKLWEYTENLIKESKVIDRYYERSDREHRSR